MKSIKISIEDGDNFELIVDGDITSISIETTRGKYIIDKTNPADKPTLKDLDDLFADLF